MTAIVRRRPPLIIANPTESDSDDSASDGVPPPPLSPPNPFSSIDPPTPLVLGPSSSSNTVPDALSSSSSRSSPAPDTTPPRTPGQSLPPVSLAGDIFDSHVSPKSRPYHHPHSHNQDRDPDHHGIGRAPLHIRKPSNDSKPSPILSISTSFNTMSPTDSLQPRIIMATADSDMFIKVNITSAHSGEAIRELIFSALQIADEDQLGLSLFQTELGESALGDALSDDLLYDMCSRSADRKGTLKFLIQRSSSHVYLRPDIRALPIPPPPTTVPPLPQPPPPPQLVTAGFRPSTRNGTRPSPQSQHDTASSTSDRRNDPCAGYDASLSDDLDAYDPARRRAALRPMQSYQQLSRPPQLPQPPSQRPSVGIHRIPRNAIVKRSSPTDYGLSSRPRTSPMHTSPGGISNGTSDSSSSYNNHVHQLPRVPSVAPLQIDRRGSITPTPPLHGAYSRSPPHSRDGVPDQWHHGRMNSETAAERERLLEQTERERNWSQPRRELERREMERRERERDKEQTRRERERGKEQTQQMRSEETQRWQQRQAILERTSGGGDSSSSQSPSDTLSPGSAWFATTERPEVRSRPGTTGNVAPRSPYHDAAAERDPNRPSTAQPILRHQPSLSGYGGGGSNYPLRATPSALVPGTRPATGSSTGSGAGGPRALEPPRSLQPAYRPAGAGASSTTMLQQQLDGRNMSPVDRGQAVPLNWLVNYRPSDGRAATLQHRLPLSPGASKSMNDLRNQYLSGGGGGGTPTSSKAPRPPLIGRRLPNPSAQRAPNNYGGYSDPPLSSSQYASPTASAASTALPYHDQPPPSRSGLAGSPYTPTRGNWQASSSTDVRGGGSPWREERPRSPQRGSPKIGVFRSEDPRPPYIPPPRTADSIVPRGEHAGSFGQAAQNLSPGLGASMRLASDTAPTLPSPLEGVCTAESAADHTLQPDDHQWILRLWDDPPAPTGSEESTLVPTAKNSPPKAPAEMLAPTIHEPEYDSEDEDEDDGESEAGTLWQKKPKRVSRPPALYPIQTGMLPPVPPVPPPQPPLRKASRNPLSPGSGNVNRHSSFTKRDSITWAFRPPPEDMYERLEEFFPDHDLDKPVIDATPSGGSSPTQAEYPPPPAAAAFPPAARQRHKKSIRVVVSDRKSKMGMGSPTAQNMFRKRSTKLWGSRVEEVTAKGGALSAAPESPPGPPNPRPIFKWVKGDLIGKGTYGRVYLALNATTGEMIAVKQVELPRTVSDQDDSRQLQMVEALKSESDTLKDLDHPNIVQYLGFEQSSEFLSIFLEYVPGGSIGGCLRKHGKFDHDVVRSFTSQMLAGLEYLHSRGVLHRDLKADNILLDPSGVCKISDFGISKRSTEIYDNDTGLTNMQGSIFWMAPEVLHNNKQGYSAKIDVWSLGCVVLEMWAGRRPWNQEDVVAVMFKLGASRQAPPVPDDVELDDVEDEFRRQCFAVNPNERPTAAELRKHTFLELRPGWVFKGFT